MDRKPYSDDAKHVDEPPLITDAERAALNIKFEYERAKKLNAMEREADTQADRRGAIELAELRLEVSKLRGVANQLRHENLMLKRQGLMQSFVSVMNQPLVDLKHDIMAQANAAQNAAPSLPLDWYRAEPMVKMEVPAERKPSILKLAISLTVRFLLVLGAAVFVLAMVAK